MVTILSKLYRLTHHGLGDDFVRGLEVHRIRIVGVWLRDHQQRMVVLEQGREVLEKRSEVRYKSAKYGISSRDDGQKLIGPLPRTHTHWPHSLATLTYHITGKGLVQQLYP